MMLITSHLGSESWAALPVPESWAALPVPAWRCCRLTVKSLRASPPECRGGQGRHHPSNTTGANSKLASASLIGARCLATSDPGRPRRTIGPPDPAPTATPLTLRLPRPHRSSVEGAITAVVLSYPCQIDPMQCGAFDARLRLLTLRLLPMRRASSGRGHGHPRALCAARQCAKTAGRQQTARRSGATAACPLV
jgi:hypothetical protein